TILNQGYGGAVALNSASATISSNSLEANVAATGLGFGGGLYMIRSTATIVDNVFHGNDAGSTGYGGAFYGQISEATFSRNVVLSSTAQYGALFPEGISPFTVTNNIIAQNEGGIFVRGNPTFGVDAIVVNNTFAYNDDYGVYVGVRSGSDSAIVMTNNIIVSHSVGIHVEDEPTNGVTATHTLFYGNGLDTDGANIASTNEITGSDPLFTEGAGTIYVLQPGSPAIDAGTLVPWLTTDIDGAPRPIGDAYDIGAYETEGVVIRRIYMPSVLGSHQP
ncbi:MAG: right-handed parallel beta-helix repeat-containing protein, partial [Anaerolineae bacterium]